MTSKNIAFNFNPGFSSSRNALGRQLAIEYYDCTVDKLIDTDHLERVFVEAAKESGATVIGSSFHAFSPHGVSGVVIIAESHFTVHTWPEHRYAAVDIFTCGDSIDFQKAARFLKKSLMAKEIRISSDMKRGFFKQDRFSPEQREQEKSDENPALQVIHEGTDDPWGMLSSIDIYHCDPGLIRDEDAIREFVNGLCDLIEMKKYGECQIVHFGEDARIAGFSVTQLIETSLISGHFANASNTAYLDIFSCRPYEPGGVAEYGMTYFKGSHYNLQVALRQ